MVFDAREAEDPDFVLVAGDLVNGHWWDGPKCIEHMSAVYYGGWVRRMQAYGLKFYVAVGDHELGDDPWPAEKIALVPHFGRAFAQHLGMPGNGPASKKGRAYYVLHKGTLIVTVETFEVVDGRMRLGVLGEQLDWLADVFKRHAAARHKIVQGHLPVIPPQKSRSSSRQVIEGGTSSKFWELMKDAGVDLYLCGEHHAVNVAEADGIWQIVHGSSWGREAVNTQDYLVCKVTPDALELELKSFPLEAKGDYMWNLHKDRGPRELVEVPAHAMSEGPRTIGTLTIRKTRAGKEFAARTGVFAEPTQLVPAAPTEGRRD
ncbi:MAG: metallophosphoesterase [Verrucomicrobiales bacterium]|nr:metallophosphoesterase [Verrucomicrobiales bacterium]